VPDSDAFVRDTEPFRRELLAHCYRMVGSVPDAEDLVQETYLRAWRFYEDFEGRSSMRTWLYRIATNACLTALTGHARRVLPSGLGDPEPDYTKPPVATGPEVSWLQPFPDALVNPDAARAPDPAAVVAARGELRLALIASLQYLPPRQRAVLVLRDVLAFSAAEVGGMLGMTTVSVKSALQRARARLRELAPAADQIAEPAAPRARALLDRYIAAFENADPAELERLLVRDATLEATPVGSWFRGRAACVPFLRAHILGPPGYWRMLPSRANGQPAAVAFTRDEHGAYLPYGVVVLTLTHDGVSGIVSFGDPALVQMFGYGSPPAGSLIAAQSRKASPRALPLT
jgi:RNA polymerase sigma-70 factor, ECF subfamily